jgi:exodeoxyribonuclease VII small subunit
MVGRSVPDGTEAGRDQRATGGTSEPAPEDTANLSFEEALTRLEETVDELRSDGLGLARALDLYEQGTRLAARCEGLLSAAELRLSRVDMATITPKGTAFTATSPATNETARAMASPPGILSAAPLEDERLEADW